MAQLFVYLVRHGEAGQAASDEHRCLTAEGRRHIRAAGQIIAEHGPLPEAIITSPLVRAVQTAEILASAVGLDDAHQARPEIAFPARISQVIDVADEVPVTVKTVMVVGHEPTMGLVAADLLPKGPRIGFRTGTILGVLLDRQTRAASPAFVITGHPPVKMPLS